MAATGLVAYRDAAVLHGNDACGSQLAVASVEVLNLLAGVQLPSRPSAGLRSA